MVKRQKTVQSRRGQYKQASRQRAHRKRVQNLRSRLKLIFGVSGGVLVSIALGWVWMSGTGAMWHKMAKQHLHQELASYGLAVQQVYLTGHGRISKHAILHHSQLHYGDSILSVSPQQIQQELQKLPQIRQVQVARHLPNTIEIFIQERRPIALWQEGKRYHLVDSDGVVLEETTPELHPQLPLMSGKEAPSKVQQLVKLLQHAPMLRESFNSAVWVNNRRWNLWLNSGIEVKLPAQDPLAALQSLEVLYTKTPLKGNEIKSVDLRVPERMFMRPQIQQKSGKPINGAAGEASRGNPMLQQAAHQL